jgi:hypothetical protein
MATPILVTVRDFTNSRYAQLAESSDNLDIAGVLASAEAIIQTRLGRQVTVTTYTEVIRNADTNIVFVKRRPITSVTSVRRKYPTPYSGWTTIAPERISFEPGPGYVEVLYDDIRGFDVEVTYQAGYAEVPAEIREAILIQAVLLATQDFEVYGTGDSKPPGYIRYMNQDIDNLLAPYQATATVYH